ncbi:MAG TPA: flagellar biosynthesis protein FlhF [Epulopiscium sp.]|nr:flagellar biosynthesis protein FlhF [Candidatus Epulonipiscium sp.]
MKIKRYQGKNEQEIIKTIKDELGPSAIILNVRTIKRNWMLRLLAKDKIEITAAIDEEPTEPTPVIKEQNVIALDTGLDELKDKMSSMEQLLTSATDKMAYLYNESYYNKEKLEPAIEQKPKKNKYKMEDLIYEHLVKQEVEEEVARALLRETDDLGENPDIQDIIRIVYNNISETIGEANIIEEKTDGVQGPQVVFFIGPTGVGKTTSIAKLTADFSLKKQKKVALITADTYRIAAIDQLRTYAEILSVPLKVAYSANELQLGIEELQDKDFIFVDTAGRSHKNDEHLGELEDMLSMFQEKQVYLVLSATTKFTDLISIIKKYAQFCDTYSIIITKTDETASAGTILNIKYYTGKSLSYVSFGQNVPDDIEIINGPQYAKILLGSFNDE